LQRTKHRAIATQDKHEIDLVGAIDTDGPQVGVLRNFVFAEHELDTTARDRLGQGRHHRARDQWVVVRHQ
jgi:hypothetical protein